MPIRQIGLDLANGNFHQALLRCWLFFRDNHPEFQKAEKSALDMSEQHNERIHELYELLSMGDSLKLRNRKYENPLALMEALDQFLFDRYSYQWPAPPCSLNHGKEKYYIYRRIAGYGSTPRHLAQTGHLQSRLRHHWVIPTAIQGFKISIKTPAAVNWALGGLSQVEELSVFVCSFQDGACPDWLHGGGNALICKELTEPDTRWKSALGAIEEAVKQKAQILVLPELSISPPLRKRISVWLNEIPDHPFLFVLPGSFHEETAAKVYNTAVLFGRRGKEMLSHAKITSYSDKEKREGNEPGDSIEFLDTPIGLIGIPICRDFCEEGLPFSEIWLEIGPEWLLVPAFGGAGSMHAHNRRATTLQRAHGTVSAIANQNPDGKNEGQGFVCHGQVDSEPVLNGAFAWTLSRIKKRLQNEKK